jgi:hypothetical protein
MRFKKLSIWWLAFALLFTGCATVSQDQALKTVKSKYPNALFVYVDAPNDAIASALMAAHLKVSSSTTSDVMVKMLLLSNSKRPGVVAGKSDMVTVATIRRAIEDTGAALPKDGLLVIVGEPAKFADTANFARDRGLTVDVLPPVEKDGSPPIIDEPLTVAPSKEQSVNLQEQVQRDSNTQMNQLLRSGSRK